MVIHSTRLGEVTAQPEDLIFFEEGFLGLPAWQSGVLVPVPEAPPLYWLQFTHDPEAALLLLEVQDFAPDFDLALAREAANLGEKARVLSIVTVPAGNFSRSTANLLAPVVLSWPGDMGPGQKPGQERPAAARRGKQVVLHDTDYPLRYPLFGGAK